MGFLSIEEGEDISNIEQELEKAYLRMLENMAGLIDDQQNGFSTQNQVDSKEIAQAKAFQQELNKDAKPQINSVIHLVAIRDKSPSSTLSSSSVSSQDMLTSNPKVLSVKIREMPSKEELEALKTAEEAHKNSAIHTEGLKAWAPTKGRVTLKGYVGSSSRFLITQMEWDSINFPRNHAYEHDLRLNNYPQSQYGLGTYLEIKQSLVRKIPIYKYRSTSWPKNVGIYNDTRLGDSKEEVSYTFGALYPRRFVAGKWYYIYAETGHGTAIQDNGKLTAQLLEGNKPRCDLQWCMFSKDSVSLIKAWDLEIPSPQGVGKIWNY